MCSIKATKARAHPLQLRQGLVWVWPEAGPEAAAEAAATPAVVAPQLDDARWVVGPDRRLPACSAVSHCLEQSVVGLFN